MTRIFTPSALQHEAAASTREPECSLSTGIAYNPSRRSLLFSKVSRRCIRAARRRLTAVSEWIAEWCRNTFGTVEFVIGDFCAICNDVHKPDEKCPRAMIGKCLDCGGLWRQLDRFGNCVKGHRSIIKRRLRYPNARALSAQREAV